MTIQVATGVVPGASPAARPRFRTDLVAEPIQEGAQRFVDVLDPDSGRGFRFYEVEYSLACAMDGERDVAGLARWAKEELGVDTSARELQTVISTLGELGYLTGERPAIGGLAPGVLAAPPAAVAHVDDVELGSAGGVAASRGELPHADIELGQAGGVSAPRIVVDDFGTGPELASRDELPPPPPAVEPMATLRPSTIPDSDDGGPTDLPRPIPLAAGDEDVSTDLSDHLAISANDVKEAVRASKVMQAVELPADIAATLAAAEAEQEARAAAAAKVAAEQAASEAAAKAAAEKAAAEAAAAAAEKAAAEKAATEAAEKAAAEKAAAAAAEKAAAEKAAAAQAAADRAAQAVVRPVETEVEKPGTRKPEAGTGTAKLPPKDKVAAKPVEPPAEPRTSRALIALLVLTILLAGAYLVWTQILKKPLPWEKTETASTQPAPAPQPPQPAPPAPPPPPPPPSSTLTEVPGAPTTVAAGQKGTIAAIVADGSAIEAGAELARFVGNPGLEKRLAATRTTLDVALAKQQKDFAAKRDAAVTANKPDAVKLWQDKLDKLAVTRTSLETEIASATAQLAAFSVKAPLAGTVKTEVAKGAKIANVEQPLASITAPPSLEAKFTPNPGKTYAIGDAARVVSKTDAAKALTCDVTAVEGSSITLKCPTGTIEAGADVILAAE